MNLQAISAHLERNRLGKQGSTLFVTEMPSTCKEGILLMDRYSGSVIDHELPGWRNTGFGMIVRSADYLRGRRLATQASGVLTIQTDVNMGEILMRQCLPYNDPRPYRRSEGGYWEFEVDVDCVYINN